MRRVLYRPETFRYAKYSGENYIEKIIENAGNLKKLKIKKGWRGKS